MRHLRLWQGLPQAAEKREAGASAGNFRHPGCHILTGRGAGRNRFGLFEAAPNELTRQSVVPHRRNGDSDDRSDPPVHAIIVQRRSHRDVGERADRAGGAEFAPAEKQLARPGEILVAPLTAPSWAPVFGKIAATVTDVGGIMSHAAIVCREYGLPAVTGTAFATKNIKTGQRLRVDGNTGQVTVLY